MKYERYDYEGIGFNKVFSFNNWSLCFLNYIDELKQDNLKYVEAHHETDEVFVLLRGKATLLLASNKDNKLYFEKIKLIPNKIYVVKKDTYHTVILNKKAKILLVEEKNTSDDNTTKIYLSKDDINTIKVLK